MEQIRILLVDGHTVLRKGLRKLIEAEQGLRVVAEADDCASALTAVRKHTPDIVITNSRLPEVLDAAAATRQITRDLPFAKVLVLSDDVSWKSIKNMLEAGAVGYLSKKCDTSDLISSIRRIADGHAWLDGEISSLVVSNCFQQNDSGTSPAQVEVLSDREREILAMMAEGKSAKQIAYELHLNCRTVAQHRQNIMKKLDLYSIADLTKYAIREGLTKL